MVSPFRVILLFALLSVLVWFVLPGLKVDLVPQDKPALLTVSFLLPKSSPEVAEQQVTSLLEGACSQISQLKKIKSVSGYNNGYIQLYFDKTTDLSYKRLELAAIIRQVYPNLPANCSYPLIIQGSSGAAVQNALLAYSINAPLQPYIIKQEAEAIFRKAFAGFSPIREAKVSGNEGLQLSVNFDRQKCAAWGINPNQITNTIQSLFSDAWPGSVSTDKGETYFLHLPPQTGSTENVENIIVSNANGDGLRLKDIASLSIEEQEPQKYLRINGKNSVTLSLFARAGENRIAVANKAKEIIAEVETQLPKGFELALEYDDTEFLKKEINKNYQRAGLSALILVFFVLLVYRSWRHLVNLLFGLFATLCITLILAWLFGVNIHMYSIAGLAISFGIITDNSIVMIDYYRQRRNRKIILALLASCCCTIAALSLVFLLSDTERKDLVDFAAIIMLALIASLATALWLTPGLHDILYGSSANRTSQVKPLMSAPKRRKVAWLALYARSLFFIARFRGAFVLLLILFFGLPVFLLPATWKEEGRLAGWYNKTIGSDHYQENIKPTVDKWLGGTLGRFYKNIYENSGYRSPEKTKLYINAELPYGNTPKQMNAVLLEFEQFLNGEAGIERFITNVYSGQSGAIEIIFDADAEAKGLPYRLKSKLVNRSLIQNGVDWEITGVGQAYTNYGPGETPAFKVLLKGYNYDELERQAELLAKRLKVNPRIPVVNTNEKLEDDQKQSREFVLTLNPTQMALYNTNADELINKLTLLSKPSQQAGAISFNNQYLPVMLREKDAENFSGFAMLNDAIKLDTARYARVKDMGGLSIQQTANRIYKEDRQYLRVIGFNYLGSEAAGRDYLTDALEGTKLLLPPGYTAEPKNPWKPNETAKNWILLITLLLFGIFFICSVLFENLKTPFFIISIIPISFIGIFLAFSVSDFYFDQGGYAAFIMLGGLVSNAGIYIVNDFNNLRRERPVMPYNKLLVKAIANRARTILLTTISTCCGLIPFLVEGQNEIFWFCLALGTMGGLAVSLFAVFVALPVFLYRVNKSRAKRKPTPSP